MDGFKINTLKELREEKDRLKAKEVILKKALKARTKAITCQSVTTPLISSFTTGSALKWSGLAILILKTLSNKNKYASTVDMEGTIKTSNWIKIVLDLIKLFDRKEK